MSKTEFQLIERLLQMPGAIRPDTLVRSGDDAAVIAHGDAYQAISTDSYVEGVHFRFDLLSPADLGVKAFHATVSDVVAMGARPSHIFLALSFAASLDPSVWEQVYEALQREAKRYGVEVAGGDVTSTSGPATVTATAIGWIESVERIVTRAGARAGDVLFVSGELGGSAAGLEVLLRNFEDYEHLKTRHRRPQARIDIIDDISQFATAMIDISDGLSSELHHICRASECGAELNAREIPLHPETLALAKSLSKDALDFALSGGEDFELLYCVPAEYVDGEMARPFPGVRIGRMTESSDIVLIKDGSSSPLAIAGFEHFRTT